MRHAVLITGAIFTALTVSVGLVVGLGHTQPLRPLLVERADQMIYTCAATSLDCGYEPGYFTLIDPAHHTWRRAGVARPTLGQLMLTFGAPDRTLGNSIVIWKDRYALLARTTAPAAAFDPYTSVTNLVLAGAQPRPADQRPTARLFIQSRAGSASVGAPWTGFVSRTRSSQGE